MLVVAGGKRSQFGFQCIALVLDLGHDLQNIEVTVLEGSPTSRWFLKSKTSPANTWVASCAGRESLSCS